MLRTALPPLLSFFCTYADYLALHSFPTRRSSDLAAGEAMLVPINARHRLENVGDEQAFLVFHLGPLAPRPDLGHVDTERSEEHTSELQSHSDLVCRLLLEKKKKIKNTVAYTTCIS